MGWRTWTLRYDDERREEAFDERPSEEYIDQLRREYPQHAVGLYKLREPNSQLLEQEWPPLRPPRRDIRHW